MVSFYEIAVRRCGSFCFAVAMTLALFITPVILSADGATLAVPLRWVDEEDGGRASQFPETGKTQ